MHSMSTIVMRVDLDCDRCYKKIRKVLCKLQDKASIKTISYDEKSKTVTVSGPFDAEEVSGRLCSGAGKVITDIHVAGGNQMMKHGAKAGPKQHGKEGHGHGHVNGHGHGGRGGGKPEKIRHVKFDMDDDGIDQHGHHGHGGGGGGGGGGGSKPGKMRHDEGMDQHAHYGHGGGGKPGKMRHDEGIDQHAHNGYATTPRVVTTTAMSRIEGPRAHPPASMTAMMPMQMPMPTMMPQAMAAPSIWPAAPSGPEWGYSATAYGGGLPAGGYYGGYGPAPGYGGYGRINPYQPPYYDEEPSAGCSVM